MLPFQAARILMAIQVFVFLLVVCLFLSLARLGLYWLLGSSVQKQALRDGETSTFLACKHSRVGVESDVVNSILMLEHRSFHVMGKLLLWLVFFPLCSGYWRAAWMHSPLALLV